MIEDDTYPVQSPNSNILTTTSVAIRAYNTSH